MDCTTFREQLPHVMGDGNAGDRAALGEHASGCPSCRQTLLEWEEAQRVLESTLGTNRTEPGELQTMADSLYAERFGPVIDVKSPAAPAATVRPVAGLTGTAIPWPLVAAAAAGLLVGYLMWGNSANQDNQLSQLLAQQSLMNQLVATGGRFPGGMPGGGGWLAGMSGLSASVGTVVRMLFAIALVVWLSRSQLWELFFPARVPKGVHMARLLVVPLVIVGVCKLGADFILGRRADALRLLGGTSNADMEIYLGVHALLDAIWTCGFWLVVFILLFTMVENLAVRYFGGSAPAEGKRQRESLGALRTSRP